MQALMRTLSLFALAALLLLAGCGSTCGPDNCAGCCDANGACQVSADATCGQQGAACTDCTVLQPSAHMSAFSCVSGQCVSSDCGACP